ncbi:MAG TPA: DPP IV N-terminal domain-containing protein [Opitutaceae bacterium]|nr:DPP IV N-terminal domain-containing protein [Opitutaceae bacterium]
MQFRSAVALLAVPVALLAQAPSPEESLRFFRDLAETRNYTLGRPVSPKLTPDGTSVIFLRAAPRSPVLRLYELTLEDAREREVLSPEQILDGGEEKLSAEEKARRERQRQSLQGFTFFRLSKDGSSLLVSLSGRLYVISRADLSYTPLPGENWIDPRFSPDGRYVAAVKDRELHLIRLSDKAVTQLTRGATETISHGTSEFIAQEEMSRNSGFWWSPDSSQLLYQETDESGVEVRYIHNPLHPEEAPVKQFYPRAGTANATVRLGLVPRAGGETRWLKWDAARFPYVARVTWDNPRAPLTVLVQNREQTEQALLAVDPATGAVRELVLERDAAWLNLDANWAGAVDEIAAPVWLKDGTGFLWATEARGLWQVELRDAEGRIVRELTPRADFYYRGIVGVDDAGANVIVRGSKDSREVHLWKFPLAGGGPEGTAGAGIQLTSGRGHHSAAYAAGTGRMVHSYDLLDGHFGCAVLDADGKPLATLRSVAESPPRWPTTELTQTRSAPAFDAAITRPRDFKPGAKYPVILQVYAGPTAKRVNAIKRDYFVDQWMADQGYIVVRIDGRGTPWRGRDWERVIKGNFIDTALNDQVAGLQALAAEHPEIDLARVGATGWSWGGYFSAMAAIRRPDIFRAGVVGAPVITWENYDTHYTERYLGLPQANPEAYRVSSVLTYVNELKRPLLLIHGVTDDNVYFQHTMQLADALFQAGKPYELLPMSGTHMISDPMIRLRRETRVMDFLNLNVKSSQ